MSEISSGSISEKQDPRDATWSAFEGLVAEFPDLFSEAFDVWLPTGWYEITRECCDAIQRIDPAARVYQLKEKFGGIRMYMNAVSPQVHTMTDALEHKSFQVCHACGAPAKTRNKGGWLTTSCDGCAT